MSTWCSKTCAAPPRWWRARCTTCWPEHAPAAAEGARAAVRSTELAHWARLLRFGAVQAQRAVEAFGAFAGVVGVGHQREAQHLARFLTERPLVVARQVAPIAAPGADVGAAALGDDHLDAR